MSAVVVPPLDQSENVPGVDRPDQRNKKTIQEKHYRFLVSHSILLTVNIVIQQIFNQQRHQRCREEQSKGELEQERKLILCRCPVLFKVREQMQHERQQKFVEEYNCKHNDHR